jgi:hypothetical protein
MGSQERKFLNMSIGLIDSDTHNEDAMITFFLRSLANDAD